MTDKLKKYRPIPMLGSFALGCALSAGQWGGVYAPWSMALVAACGATPRGLGALLGALLGGYLFFPFSEALRHGATALLTYAAALSFAGSRWERSGRFAPLSAAGALLVVHSVYLVGRSFRHGALWIVAAAATYVLTKRLRGISLRERTETVGLGLCLALLEVSLDGLSLGRLGAVWLALWLSSGKRSAEGTMVGACIGLALDLGQMRPDGVMTTILTMTCCAVGVCRSRSTKALTFCAMGTFLAVLLDFDGAAPLAFELLIAAAAYLLTPEKLRREVTLSLPSDTYASRATAFRALYDALFGDVADEQEENPAVIFDRTAEKVCRTCPQAARCYHKEYQSTHDAFTHAAGRLLARGQGARGDFPDWFAGRCERFGQFLTTVNEELYGYLLRLRYRRRLQELRKLASLPYAQMGEAMETAAAIATQERAVLEIFCAKRPKEGMAVCGDETDVLTVGGVTYLILSDGMGSGAEAHAESAMTVRLLRQFLEAGITAEASLQTLNTALRLRGGDGFTTIDLTAFHRESGRVSVHKYGAADSYYRCGGGQVERLSCATLPAGLETGQAVPAKLHLRHDDILVMVSDGVVSRGDGWLRELLQTWSGSAEDLAQAVLDGCREADDDCAVIAAKCRRTGVSRV